MLRLSILTVVICSLLACIVREERAEDCPPPAHATCIAGQQVSCPCADGTMGVQSCKGIGAFSLCECAGSIDAGGGEAGDASPGDAALD